MTHPHLGVAIATGTARFAVTKQISHMISHFITMLSHSILGPNYHGNPRITCKRSQKSGRTVIQVNIQTKPCLIFMNTEGEEGEAYSHLQCYSEFLIKVILACPAFLIWSTLKSWQVSMFGVTPPPHPRTHLAWCNCSHIPFISPANLAEKRLKLKVGFFFKS